MLRYAYLKPGQGDSPFYVHLTLDGAQRTLRVYWHMSWWKNEVVEAEVFVQWHKIFRELALTLERCKSKERKHSYGLQGRCRVSSELLRDVMGYVEANTLTELPVKLSCYVNTQNKMVEIEMKVAYSPLGSLPVEWLKLTHVFTANPDYETVRPKLSFFNPSRVLRRGVVTTVAAALSLEGSDLPRHHGSPDVARKVAELSTATLADLEASGAPLPPLALAGVDSCDIAPDPTLNTWDGHPYARPLVHHGDAVEPVVVGTEPSVEAVVPS